MNLGPFRTSARQHGFFWNCRLQDMLRGTTPRIRSLFLSDGKNALSEAQFHPFLRHKTLLNQSLGMTCHFLHVDPSGRPPAKKFLRDFDLVALKFHYKAQQVDLLRFATELRESMPKSAKLVYCDGNDEVTIQWPELLHICDLYWKKQLPRDIGNAVRKYSGSTNLTHWLEGLDVSEAPLKISDETLLSKISCAPSLALNDKIAAGLNLLNDPAIVTRRRSHDVILRSDVPDNWMGRLRKPPADILKGLAGKLPVYLPLERVSPEQYAGEMMDSRICVSPFGYGEICYRDYEAALYGCLLIKPDMSHVQSDPDMFIPGKTYIPVSWDFRDLEETIYRWLDDETGRLRIVENARQVLRESLEPGFFLSRVKRLLIAAGLT